MGTQNSGHGLTFIELVIVTAMLAVVGLALYATFSAGVKILKKIQVPIAVEDTALLLDKFAVDVENSHAVKPLLFNGTAEAVEIPTLVTGRAGDARTVGKVRYLYKDNSVKRQEFDYAAAYNEQADPVKTVSYGVKSAKFSYYLFDGEKREYVWSDAYAGTALPCAVRMELIFDDGAEAKTFTKTVSVPVFEQPR